ncbi:MAG: hypothetical protein ABL864_05190 [Terricaulis sp.]
MRLCAIFVLVLTLALARPLAAEPPSAAVRLYAAGQYLAAADNAANDDSPDNLAFAARALLAACITGADRDQTERLLDRAERFARNALTLDPGAIDARLQLALVYGMRGRRASLPEALARNYAPRGRRLIEEARALSPEDARAYALLGAWHLEVLRRGGRAGAFAYGARFSDGQAAFERALTLAPTDPMIPLHYAIALIELDEPAHAARAAELLELTATLPARDAFEEHAQQVAAAVARVLAQQGPRAASTLAERLSP